MEMKVALYARVSTNKDQTVENQLVALRAWAIGRGHEVVREFTDQGVSGIRGRGKRPGLDEMLRAATRGEVAVVACTALDRLGRSLAHLVALAQELQALKVGLYVHNLAMDTATPAGQLMFGVMASLAAFERELIRERTLLGLERARKQGKKLGRPTVPATTERRIINLLQAGVGINRSALLAQTSKSVVLRIKKELAPCPPPSN
jgi:DNA invertase Pin-like site-specific DNA recombinase